MEDLSDAPAVAACQAGDLSAFDTLYMRHVDSIHGYLSRRSPDRATAEDLTSQTFLKAMEAIKSYDGNKGPLRAWLFTIARNLLMDQYRRGGRTTDLELAENVASEESVSANVHLRLQSEELKKAVATLNAAQKEIVTLRVWEGLSYAEIAAITGKKEGHCKVIFFRAVENLRGKLPLALFIALLLPPTLPLR